MSAWRCKTRRRTPGGAGNDTLSGIENLTGSAFNDGLAGDDGNNRLNGLAGDDVLTGGDGDDSLGGGTGNDTASYEDAAAGVTVNLALLGPQNTGGAGIDTLISIEGVIGSAFNDTLSGDAGNNVLGGLDGNDMLNGGAGDDILVGGNGNDTASYADATAGVTVSLATAAAQNTGGAGTDTLIAIENLTGSAFNDTLTGDLNANILSGGAGDDTLSGGAGNNSLVGAAGNDTLTGGAGNDTLDGGATGTLPGSDTASYADAAAAVTVSLAIAAAQNTLGAGVDTLINIENLTGSNFNDTLTGNTAANILSGGAGNDTLSGGAGNDSLIGAAGNDTLIGGAGNDSLDGGATGSLPGSDTASYADATAGVTVSLAIAAAQNTIGAGVDTLINIENLTGSNFNDTLTGNTAANILSGGAGNDSLNGGAGNNSLIGAAGNDTLIGGAGNDSLDGGRRHGSDTASYADATAGVTVNLAIAAAQNTIGAGVDTLINIENLTGSNLNDTLTGNTAANILNGGIRQRHAERRGRQRFPDRRGRQRHLRGGAGNDSMDGGAAGTDTASYADATAGVTVNLATAAAQNTIGAGVDTLHQFREPHRLDLQRYRYRQHRRQ